jgi:hypothetical protein
MGEPWLSLDYKGLPSVAPQIRKSKVESLWVILIQEKEMLGHKTWDGVAFRQEEAKPNYTEL